MTFLVFLLLPLNLFHNFFLCFHFYFEQVSVSWLSTFCHLCLIQQIESYMLFTSKNFVFSDFHVEKNSILMGECLQL